MKNLDIISLCNTGILDITSNELNAEDAYKVYRFLKELRKINKNISDSEKDLIAQAGIENPVQFDRDYQEAREQKDTDKIKFCEERLYRLNDLRNILLSEDTNLPEFKTISYESWHKLQQENPAVKGLYGSNEELLENVLWVSPTEE